MFCLLPTAYRLLLMRWLPFAILAYVVLALQLGLSGYDTLYGGRPQLVLLAGIFIALNASRDAALGGCLILGLLLDLLTAGGHPVGVSAFAYAVVAIFVISTQELVYREHFLTHITLGLLGGLVVGLITYFHSLIYSAVYPKLPRVAFVPLLTSAVYTAVLAPIVLLVLQRVKKLFGFRASRGGHSHR